jgi:hypothetical protein
MGYSVLRVINEDRVQPGTGFGTHSHNNMEIVTYVLEGALEHKDSLGNGSIIKPGDVQRMSAGTGVSHSEFNASQTEIVHLLQIWIEPKTIGIPPGYEQKYFGVDDKAGRLCLVASPDGHDDSVLIHQDAYIYASVLDTGAALEYSLSPGRKAYLHVARGDAVLNDQDLTAGDAAKVISVDNLHIGTNTSAEILLFDLP